jgi:hypothetical protein
MASNSQLSADSLGMYLESYWLPAAGNIAKYFHFGVRNVQEQLFSRRQSQIPAAAKLYLP